jgi:OOP family OmpA-OmpF porin
MRYLTLILLIATSATAQVANTALLNSSADEQSPVLTPDGKQLFFTLSGHVQNTGGARDPGDIWVSILTESGWSAPIRTGDILNNNLHNTVAGFSADGKRMYLIGHYQPGKQVTSQGLSVSEMTSTGWSAPKNIVIPYFKNKSPLHSGFISADEKTLVFSAESYSTFGADDIYVSVKNGDKWSEPVNIGDVINTKKEELSPSLSADGRRLYFASNGHKGMGSFDIFYSDRLDDTWKNWSPPQNMGAEINTEGRELYYRESTSGAFLTTTLNSDGEGDIRFKRRGAETPDPGQIVAAAVVPALIAPAIDSTGIKEIIYKPEDPATAASTRIVGRISNSKTNDPVAGALVLFHSTEQQVETNATSAGAYSALLPGIREYHVRIEAPGYIGRFEKLDLQTQTMKELEMNFSLQPVEVGTTINLKSVLFVQSKPVLLEESYDELDMVVDFMKQNPKVEIELAGHTDNRGRSDQNMKLSRERVNTVKEYLVKKGIEGKRISGKGYGGTRPITENVDEETRAMNRRVEFTIVKD